jgi:CubicO group peptidase (beta-lactamase class C family)
VALPEARLKEIAMKLKMLLSILTILLLTMPCQITLAQEAGNGAIKQPVSADDAKRLARLEALLEAIRQELKIPAYSAAVVKDQKVIWARGFGYADLERKVPATEHTAYHLASLTKTFASTVLMKLVQDGKVKLDDPVSKYGITLESDGVIRVRHLLSHTSEGNPGERYSYNGNRFGELDKVIQKATGKSFAELLIADILEPLGMSETAPSMPEEPDTKPPGGGDPKAEAEVKAALTDLYAAANSGDADLMAKHLAPQQNGFRAEGQLLSKFADVDDIRAGFKAGLKLNYKIHDLNAAVYGDTALTTCIITGTITPPNGQPFNSGPWRSTFVWNRQLGAW